MWMYMWMWEGGITFLEGRRPLEEVPVCELGGLACAVGAVCVERLLHLHVDDESHHEGVNLEVVVGNVQLQLAGEQGARARRGQAIEDQRRRLDPDGQRRRAVSL